MSLFRVLQLCSLSVLCSGRSVGGPVDPEAIFGVGTSVKASDIEKVGKIFEELNEKLLKEFKESGKEHTPPVLNVARRKPKTEPDFMDINKDILEYLFQGDIVLNPEQAASLLKTGRRTKRGVQTNPNGFWTVGQPIPYYFDPSITAEAKAVIVQAIQYWQNTTCLTFVENSTTRNRLRFFKGSGCSSSIGKQFNQDQQDVSIGSGCEGFGIVAHEIGHALGFFHTQSRPDRDSFLFVDFNNIIPSLAYNFAKNSLSEDNTEGLAYDYGSVMQYDAYAFTVDNSRPSLVALDKHYQDTMGQREGPAFSDVKTMNLAYKCGSKCSNQAAVTCQNRGFQNPNSCSTCLCPKYFSGNDCSQLPKGSAPICNGQELQASTSWQSLTASVGQNTYAALKSPTDCFWHIKAPAGKTVLVMMTATPTYAGEACAWQGIDLNLGQFDMYGVLLCERSDVNTVFPASGNFAAVRGLSRYNINNFTLSYMYV